MLFARERPPEAFARRGAGKLAAGTRWRVSVGHCDAPAEGERLLAALRARLEISESFLAETGAAVGSHAGPGPLIVAVQPSPVQ